MELRRRGRGDGASQAADSDSRAEMEPQRRAWPYMALLALQYGIQPIISKRYSGKEVIISTTVLGCEIAKTVFALVFMFLDGSIWRLHKEWNAIDALTASALPAGIYAVQNTLLQLSYRHLDSLTFSLLNQTKLLFTAVFMFFLLGITQTKQQIGALLLLVSAAVLLSFGQKSSKSSADVDPESTLILGVIPILVASMLSGLASTLCQWAAQVKRRSTYLMTVEMSTFGSLFLIASLLKSPDGEAIRRRGYFSGWTTLTLLPLFTNAFGGILVGLVTTYAGGVRKGFVIVSALVVTALLQFALEDIPPSIYVLVAMPMVISSTVIYQRYSGVSKKKKAS
ncbi:CMP-sialic acid transporter 5-like [Selaginella moellendorffii]|uniref:CMP-sialic acid transporter 5-like n=1 Tax=Selaginella moellendorffii TaxID=88036 RepID=UPI000D1C8110|nr:CMP-sialic acid transporter 5-like [Selaginella moellendorffii]|eukprot:XP_024540194.1 CMP-sialic acid transporter 5-like [Selaginella moellendorffii]